MIFAAITGGTVVVSILIGVAAGSGIGGRLGRALRLRGGLLVGCFVVGARGPLRGVNRTGETVPVFGARRVRRATGDERSDSTRIAILLFVLGLGLVVVAALIDPAHRAF